MARSAHCVMCGKEGMGPKEASETSAGVVVIPKQQKGVCGGCSKAWWLATNGCYFFKYCQGHKTLCEIHAFEGRLHAAKCNKARPQPNLIEKGRRPTRAACRQAVRYIIGARRAARPAVRVRFRAVMFPATPSSLALGLLLLCRH